MVEYDKMIEFLNTESETSKVYPNQTTYTFHGFFRNKTVMVHIRQKVIDIFTTRWERVETLKQLIDYIDLW